MSDFIKMISLKFEFPIIILIFMLTIVVPIFLNYLTNKKINTNKQYCEISFNELQNYFNLLLRLIAKELTEEDKEKIVNYNLEKIEKDEKIKKNIFDNMCRKICSKYPQKVIENTEKYVEQKIREIKPNFNQEDIDNYDLSDNELRTIILDSISEKEREKIFKNCIFSKFSSLHKKEYDKKYKKYINDIVSQLVRLGKKNTVYYLSLISLKNDDDIDNNLFNTLNLEFLNELPKTSQKKLFDILRSVVLSKILVSLKKDTLDISMSFLDVLQLNGILNKKNKPIIKYFNQCIILNKISKNILFIFPSLDKQLSKYNKKMYMKLKNKLFKTLI